MNGFVYLTLGLAKKIYGAALGLVLSLIYRLKTTLKYLFHLMNLVVVSRCTKWQITNSWLLLSNSFTSFVCYLTINKTILFSRIFAHLTNYCFNSLNIKTAKAGEHLEKRECRRGVFTVLFDSFCRWKCCIANRYSCLCSAEVYS